jgi:predicted ATPase
MPRIRHAPITQAGRLARALERSFGFHDMARSDLERMQREAEARHAAAKVAEAVNAMRDLLAWLKELRRRDEEEAIARRHRTRWRGVAEIVVKHGGGLPIRPAQIRRRRGRGHGR